MNLGSGLPKFTNNEQPSRPASLFAAYRSMGLFILADFWVKQPFALLAEQLFLRLYLTS